MSSDFATWRSIPRFRGNDDFAATSPHHCHSRESGNPSLPHELHAQYLHALTFGLKVTHYAQGQRRLIAEHQVEIKTVGVLGAGTMGHGIAQILVRSGYTVLLNDVSQQFLDSGAARIAKGLNRDVEKDRLTEEEREQAVTRLKTTTRVADLAAVDFIIEAVTEKFEVKAGVFRSLEPHCRPETIFASNTSSISITRLAAATERPERFVGLHFFNPVPVMKLVEVVPGLQTAPETVERPSRWPTPRARRRCA